MERFSLVPAAYVLLVRGHGHQTEVLLQLRGPECSWLPGHWATGAAGHVEAGEQVGATARREAAEELGVSIDEADLEPLCTLHRTQPGVSDLLEQRVDFYFLCRSWRGTPTVREPGKCAELRWVSPSSLPSPMVPHEAEVLARVADAVAHGTPVPAITALGFD